MFLDASQGTYYKKFMGSCFIEKTGLGIDHGIA